MKTILGITGKLIVFSSVISSFVLSSCSKNNDSAVMYTVSGSANGSQLVPAVSGSATGNISGTYNRNTNMLSYNMTWTGLSEAAFSAGFYSGAPGGNGSLISNTSITTAGSTGASVGMIVLTDEEETALLNGNLYYTVSTTTHTSGEVRGQITLAAQ